MLSLPHLVVIFVVALVIFGPHKLPELARMLGKLTAEFRRMTSDFRFALEHEVQDLERQSRLHEEEKRVAESGIVSAPTLPEGAVPRQPEALGAVTPEPQALPPEFTGEPGAPHDRSTDDNAPV